jgi:hypothetical protein
MRPFFLFAALWAAATLNAHSQIVITNNQLRVWEDKLWFTAQERVRLEYRENNVTFNDHVDKDTDLWVLQRARLGMGVKPVDWLKAFGELQDAREMDSTRVPVNADLEEDTIDWRQGWIELNNYKHFPLGIKVGRQELSYGDERLIGTFDWNNAGRVFDAVKVRWQSSNFWVDLFAGDVVLNNVTLGNRDNSFDDRPYWQDDFFGIYGQSQLCPFQLMEGYVLYRDKDDATYDGPAREIVTLGARIKTNAKLLPWDYYAEVAGQLGEVDKPGLGAPQGVARRFGDNSLQNGADHAALAAVIGAGFAFTNCPAKPRVGLEYNYASGDSDPTDGDNGTFDNLYPTNHKFFGYMDLFAWKNVHNPRVMLSASPYKTVVVQLDYHLFWLVEDEDFWYRANQSPVGTPARRDVTGGSDSYVGSELDLTITWTACKYVKVLGGYSHFFSGGSVDDTKGGANGDDDADFLYLQTALSF